MAYQSTFDDPGRDTNAFYRRTLHVLSDARVPFLVGGSHALLNYTGIVRETKDFDLFLRRADLDAALDALREAGYTPRSRSRIGSQRRSKGTTSSTSCSAPAMACAGSTTSGFSSRIEADVLGMPVKIAPVEELLWQKAFVMERERYDGADVAHILRSLRRNARLGSRHQAVRSALAAAAVVSRAVRVHLSVGTAPHPDRVVNELTRARRRRRGAAERGPRLSRNVAVARAVPARHRPLRLRGRAPRAARQHDRRGCGVLDLGDRERSLKRMRVR